MKAALKLTSFGGLALILAGAALLFAGIISRHAYLYLALAGTALWFATVPFWMRHRLHHSED